jgi:hypothetical protein
MTTVLERPKCRKSPHFALPVPRRRVERLLRDAAFVLEMTRRVKESIVTGKPLTAVS